MICQECGMEIEGNEYHPYAFCVLVKAGLNPLSVVLEAASQLIPAEAEQPTEPDADGGAAARGAEVEVIDGFSTEENKNL